MVTRFLGSLNPNVTPPKPFSSTVGHRSGSTGYYRRDGLYNFWRSPPRGGGGRAYMVFPLELRKTLKPVKALVLFLNTS